MLTTHCLQGVICQNSFTPNWPDGTGNRDHLLEDYRNIHILSPQEEESEMTFLDTYQPNRLSLEPGMTYGTLEETGLTQQFQNPSLRAGEAVVPDVAIVETNGRIREVKSGLRLYQPRFGEVPVEFYMPRTVTGNFLAVAGDIMVPFVVVFYVTLSSIAFIYLFCNGIRNMAYLKGLNDIGYHNNNTQIYQNG